MFNQNVYQSRLNNGLNPIPPQKWNHEVGKAGETCFDDISKSFGWNPRKNGKMEADYSITPLRKKCQAEIKNWSIKSVSDLSYKKFKKEIASKYGNGRKFLFISICTPKLIAWCRRLGIHVVSFGKQIVPDEFWGIMTPNAKKNRIALSDAVRELKSRLRVTVISCLASTLTLSFLTSSRPTPDMILDMRRSTFGMKSGKPPPPTRQATPLNYFSAPSPSEGHQFLPDGGTSMTGAPSSTRAFEPRCKVCRSIYRQEYEKMGQEGHSYRDIAFRAKEEFKETISHVAIRSHFKNHARMPIVPKKSEESLECSSPLVAHFKDKVLVDKKAFEILVFYSLAFLEEWLERDLETLDGRGKEVSVGTIGGNNHKLLLFGLQLNSSSICPYT